MTVFLQVIRKIPFKIVIFIGILMVQSFVVPSSLRCQIEFITESDTTEQSQHDELLDKVFKIDYATQCARNAVEAFADSAFLPELLFNLSEWEIQRERAQFELAMRQYDQKLQLYQQSKLDQEPTEPILKFEEALKINKQIIKEYPDVPFINKVFYRTGLCLFEIGKSDSAKQLFLKVEEGSLDSTYQDDFLFRLGECFFDDGNYEQAIAAYSQILKDWKSPFFAMALYKIGWCHYRLNHYSDAISTFYYLLSDINILEKINTDLLGLTPVQLKNEILEYIAISFSDFRGVASLLNFIDSVEGSSYTPSLLHKLGKIYLQRDFYEDALQALTLLKEKYSDYERLPEVFAVFFECYEKMGDMKKAHNLHNELIAYCGPKSNWSKMYSSSEFQQIFNSNLKEIDYKIATPLLSTADSLFVTNNYQQGVKKYSEFLQLFKNDERIDHASFYLAECYFNLNDYNKAGITYKKIVLYMPQSQLREDAAYNYVICCDKVFNDLNLSLEEPKVSIKQVKELKDLVVACNNFLNWYPESKKEPEIKLKLGEIFYRKKLYDMGEKYVQSALESINKHKRGAEHRVSALILLMQLNFRQKKFKDAELISNLLVKENADSAGLIERCNKILASTSFKRGEELKSIGKSESAALMFEQAALKSSDPYIVEASLFESAIQYEQAQQLSRAALKFEEFYEKYPGSAHFKEAIYRAALLREKIEQYQFASRNYLKLHKLIPNTAEGSAALFSAGLAFEKAKDWDSMAATFKQFIMEYPTDDDRIFEAIFKLGHAYEQQGLVQQASLEYRKLITKYNQMKASGEFADDYLVAEANFRLAEIEYENFKTIRLAPPLQESLKRKQTKLNEIMKLYVNVAKFNIAEWTTAAFYRLGLAYEYFCQDITFSPEPPNLTGEELEIYWKSINQQWVIPLLKEALKYYQTNEKIAAEKKLLNDWIEKTRARILFLNEKLSAETSVNPHNNQIKEAIGTVTSEAIPARKKL